MEVIGNKYVIYEFGRFVLDPKERTLFEDGRPIHLPAKEFDTLVLLVEHNAHALSKEEMMSAIWHDSFVEESNLAKQVSRLRKIFNTDGEVLLETLPKHGYRFTADLRRTIIEPEDEIILERRTVKRVTFAIENELEPQRERLALPPARRRWFTIPQLSVLVAAILTLGVLTWYYRDRIFRSKTVIDSYAPVRLTDNPNDDSNPWWTRDARICFVRTFSDDHSEVWIMQPDGSGQELLKMPEGKKIFAWSPDGRKIEYVKPADESKAYLSNADGSDEILLPFRGGSLSADSKMITYHQRVSGDDFDIFVYFVETGESRNITNMPSFEADPSFSPDGKKVVFASNRDGNAEIYSVNIDGSELRRLTNDPALDAHPAYSPDGTQILFGSVREDENGDAYVMDIDGSNVVKVTHLDKSNETVGPGGWSPDGTKIVFYSDRNGKDDVYVMSAETVRPKLLLADEQHDLTAPSYAPDGKKIVYAETMEDKTGELRVFDLDSRSTTLVKKTELPLVVSDWSPDGKWIVFSDRPKGNSDIFRIRPDGKDLEDITNDPSVDTEPSYSPNGEQIVFISSRGEPAGSQLYVINADGSGVHPLTPRKGFEGNPSWAPEGNSIVFVCDRLDSRGNLLDVCEINVDGADERRVLFHRDHDYHPVVSPDGKRIAFTAHSDGNLEIYVVNRDGTGLRRLTRDPADDGSPDWSPDGRSIIFAANRTGKFAIYQVDVP